MVLGLYWNLPAASAPTAHASMTRRQAEEAHRIRCERFQVGDCWTWLYRDANGDPSSWERYTVSTARGSDLEIELASKFAADEEFTAHHRMRLSLEDALGAREAKSDWQLRRFDFLDGIFWRVAPHRDNTQAFEEKFDVFSMRSAATAESGSATRSQEVAALGRSDLYRSRRHEYTGAWYVRDGSHAGCAAFKSFGPEGGADSFTFELVGVGARGDRAEKR